MKTLHASILMTITCFFAAYFLFLPVSISIGFLIWGLILAYLVGFGWALGWFGFDVQNDNLHNQWGFFTIILNGIGINFGLYIIIWIILNIYLNIPLPVGG